MTRVVIGPFDAFAAKSIAANMRPADVEELRAVNGCTPAAAMRAALTLPGERWAAYVEDRAVAAFGVSLRAALGGRGVPWFLGTPEVDRLMLSATRAAHRFVSRWAAQHQLLENYVDGRNGKVMRWLRRLGFEVAPSAGAALTPARHFMLRGPSHV